MMRGWWRRLVELSAVVVRLRYAAPWDGVRN